MKLHRTSEVWLFHRAPDPTWLQVFGPHFGSKISGASTEAFKLSEYSSHFNSHDNELYIKKIKRVNITDPYNAPGVLSKSISAEEDVPHLQYPIYNYLINFPSFYTGDSLKAYKSLKGFKWTQSGFVTNIQLWKLQAKQCFIVTLNGKYPSLISSLMSAWLVWVRVVCLC